MTQRAFNGAKFVELVGEAGFASNHSFAVALVRKGYASCSGTHVAGWIKGKRPKEDTLSLICKVLGEQLGRKVKNDELLVS